ncbi:hypothetical protein ACFSSC_08655 [Corynebacterium mendelii]|uniref:hypothetical protein n=1 Tax=Corynebacterium mendelii TaxID=2765362 RepID=UPI001A91DB38|nr:hypothetical protein [Corynebacterium mendelii]
MSVSLVSAATAVAVMTTGVVPASAATARIAGGTCIIDDTPELAQLGAFAGTVGEFFTELRSNIRADVPAAFADFDRADALNQRLIDTGGNDRQAVKEIIEIYTRIDQTMHDAGYKYGEWQLAFPQMIANNKAFNPVQPLTPGQAAAVRDDREGFAAAVAAGDLAARVRAFNDGYAEFTNNASPRLLSVINSTRPDPQSGIRQLDRTDFSRVADDYAAAAARCADLFAEAGITAAPTSTAGAVPDTYLPDIATVRGSSGPGDTAIFEPLKNVQLHQGTSSEIGADAWIVVIGVAIAIVAARGPWIISHLPEFLAHPPQLPVPGFPPAPQIGPRR